MCGVCNDNFKNIFISIFRRPHMGSRPQGWKTTIVLKSKSTSLLCVRWSFDAGFFYIRSECLNSLLVILSIKYLLFSIRVEWTVRRTSCFRSWCTGMKLPFLLASPFCVTGPKMESQRTKVRISFMFFLSCRFFSPSFEVVSLLLVCGMCFLWVHTLRGILPTNTKAH